MAGSRQLPERVIRPATDEDRDFLRLLFTTALGSYYDGDHAAHADRILDAHLADGHDADGHFSLAQRTFILRSGEGPGSARLGVLHLVVKRQGTIKISPLILVPRFRRRAGLGTLLLRFAEDFAHHAGARQLYCTVAASNTPALGLFTSSGFVVAGRSPGQYKPGVTEYLLYKDLLGVTAEPEGTLPFRLRLYDPQDAAAVRGLVLRNMPDFYRGIDAGWVASLIAGHTRRGQRDVNRKYKIVYVAEDSRRRVTAVVAAGPKKGEPVKLMPLCAESPAVLGRLLAELPSLFTGLGRKLYTHLPATPGLTMQMQRARWTLEGLMPGAYHPDFCTVQWGLALPAAPPIMGASCE
ncbi:GNAT family N-acetyltransferase [Streptomyces sp. MNP-20]|uniref:GNAT family N-acetyltransferase n=1 Tax=Streptomyces sp. MNP-20 TaxID=2721165 RepID=UPI0015563B60|nr:GNAT family N-acetyltransferase [Streptomyces sp. MNP-20]